MGEYLANCIYNNFPQKKKVHQTSLSKRGRMSGKPKKNITILDIASHANVSKATVSRVINGTAKVNADKKNAVLAAMKEMNFEPNVFAQGLASGSSKTIGVLTQDIGSPIYDAIAQGVLSHLTPSNYSPIFADGQWKPDVAKAAVQTLIGRKVDGLIAIGNVLSSEDINRIGEQHPLVIAGWEVKGWEEQCLFIDNEQAGYDATKHLLDLGHRDIAHIAGGDHQDAVQRMAGYRRALEEAGVEVDEDLVFPGNFDGHSGVMAVESFLSKGKTFSAVFAANDMMAFGAKLALSRRGFRVPEDISIIGFDDQTESAYTTPPLTTVKQPARELGKAAASALLKLIHGEEIEIPEFPTQIVVRESTRVRG